MKKVILSELCLLGILARLVAGISGGTGGYAGAFLQLPVSPRAIAMGGAFVALVDDAAAVYWNPAGIAEVSRVSAVLSHSRLTLDRQHNFGVLGFQLGGNRFAVGVNNFVVKGIEKRDSDGQRVGEFDDSETSLMLGYGRSFDGLGLGEVDVGISGKFLFQSFDDVDAKGYGIDVGAKVSLLRGIKLGLVMYDIMGVLRWSTGVKEHIPMRVRGGLGIEPAMLPVRAEVDASYNLKSGGIAVFVGGEVRVVEMLYVRGGYDARSGGPSFGVGVSVMPIEIDYTYSQDRLGSGALHHVGVKFSR